MSANTAIEWTDATWNPLFTTLGQMVVPVRFN